VKQSPTREQGKTKRPAHASPATPAPPRSKAVDTKAPEQSSPDQREITDDLIEALQPGVAPLEHPEEPSTPKRTARPRPVERAAADPQASKGGTHTPLQRRESVDRQYCQIRLWRGYFKWQFYAEREGTSGAFAESALFRLRNPSQPDAQVQRALESLLAELERFGWSIVESGPVWYQRRLQRSSVDAPWRPSSSP
jgi:hypothetical protein